MRPITSVSKISQALGAGLLTSCKFSSLGITSAGKHQPFSPLTTRYSVLSIWRSSLLTSPLLSASVSRSAGRSTGTTSSGAMTSASSLTLAAASLSRLSSTFSWLLSWSPTLSSSSHALALLPWYTPSSLATVPLRSCTLRFQSSRRAVSGLK